MQRRQFMTDDREQEIAAAINRQCFGYLSEERAREAARAAMNRMRIGVDLDTAIMAMVAQAMVATALDQARVRRMVVDHMEREAGARKTKQDVANEAIAGKVNAYLADLKLDISVD